LARELARYVTCVGLALSQAKNEQSKQDGLQINAFWVHGENGEYEIIVVFFFQLRSWNSDQFPTLIVWNEFLPHYGP